MAFNCQESLTHRTVIHSCPSGQFPWLSERNKINRDRQISARSTRRLQKNLLQPSAVLLPHPPKRAIPTKTPGHHLRLSTSHALAKHASPIFVACPPWRTCPLRRGPFVFILL